MTAENVGQTAGLSVSGFAHWAAGPSTRERNFYIALVLALIVHASFFISAAQNSGGDKRLGSETGADNAISVSLVTEQDLDSKATVVDQVSPPPGPIAPTQEKQQAKPQPEQPPQQQQPPAPPEQAKQEPLPPQPEQPPPEPQAQDTPKPPEEAQPDVPQDTDPAKPEPETVAKQEDTSPESQARDLFSLDDQDPSKLQSSNEPKPKPTTKPEQKPEAKKPSTSKPAKKSAAKAQKKVAALDFSTQALAPSFSGGGGAAFQRPPGITRSGLNDAFARAVIRALQQTMPQLQNTLGRVTVRIFLSDSGNVVNVKLLAGSKDPSLNQDVVFAAKQTSYPIPPAGSNEADRTFMVTYIYD